MKLTLFVALLMVAMSSGLTNSAEVKSERHEAQRGLKRNDQGPNGLKWLEGHSRGEEPKRPGIDRAEAGCPDGGPGWDWGLNLNRDEIIRRIVQDYGYNTTSWLKIINIFSDIYEKYPELFEGRNVSTDSSEITGTFTYKGKLVTLNRIEIIVQKLIDENVLNYRIIQNGKWRWTKDFDSVRFVRTLVERYGQDTSYWSMIITLVPQVYLKFTDLFGSPTVIATTPSQPIGDTTKLNLTSEDMKVLIKEFFLVNVTNYGNYANGKWTWNRNFNKYEFARLLVRMFGYDIAYWIIRIDLFPRIYIKLLPFIVVRYSPIVTTYKGIRVTITEPWHIVSLFNRSNILSYYEFKNGQLVWKSNLSKTRLANYLVTLYGYSVTYWLVVIDSFPVIFKNYAVAVPGPRQFQFETTFKGVKYVINDTQRLFDQLRQSGVLGYLKFEGGKWFLSSKFNPTLWANYLVNQYGNEVTYWLAVLSSLPNLYTSYLDFLSANTISEPTKTITITGSDGEKYEITNLQLLLTELNQTGVLSYVENQDGQLVLSDSFDRSEWAQQLTNQFAGNSNSYWYAVFDFLPSLISQYRNLYGSVIQTGITLSGADGKSYVIRDSRRLYTQLKQSGVFRCLQRQGLDVIWRDSYVCNKIDWANRLAKRFGSGNYAYWLTILDSLPQVYFKLVSLYGYKTKLGDIVNDLGQTFSNFINLF